MSEFPPAHATTLVIGGGPGGSYTASVLAREGQDVVVLESDKFPRYHVGESQLASLRHFLRFIDLEDDFEKYGFTVKVGAAFKLNKNKREGYTDFVATDPNNYSWNIVRAESDELMLRHAQKQGAKVYEEYKVTEIEWSPSNPVDSPETSRPIAASWKKKSGETGRITFDYVVDASGRNGIISTKYLKNREFNSTLKNVASWGYWKGCGQYMPGTPRGGSPYFEALADSSGWGWIIPLHDGSTSVGVVMNQELSEKLKAKAKEAGEDTSSLAHYMRGLDLAPGLRAILGNAVLIKKDDGPILRSASDYSYRAPSYAGPGYRIVGDAGAFIDPYFSSGVHLALSGGLSAAASIRAVQLGQASEAEAAKFFTAKLDTSFSRFLVVVLSVYKHIRSQDSTMLSEKNEDNFDRAFMDIRPVIQGNIDSGKKLSGDQLDKLVGLYSKHAFTPSEPEKRAELLKEFGDDYDPTALDVSTQDDASKAILKSMAVRKLFRIEDINHINNYVADAIEGFRLNVEVGKLGMQRA